VNKYKPHLLVLAEDLATHDIAVGFNDYASGAMEVLKYLRGWPDVLAVFEDTYIGYLREHPDAHIVLLIDFDNVFPARLQRFQNAIPADISERVFVLGALDEAETVKSEVGLSLSQIGIRLAQECDEGVTNLWGHAQVQHNHNERLRLHAKCCHFLF
jgi:hypothetical protein